MKASQTRRARRAHASVNRKAGGAAWASIMASPCIMLAGSVPPERTGGYIDIFKMFIVIPMIIPVFTLPLIYRTGLNGEPGNVVRLAGALLLCAAAAVLFVELKPAKPAGRAHRNNGLAVRLTTH